MLFYLIHWQIFKSCIIHFFQTLQKRWGVKHLQNKNGKKDNVTSSNRNSFFEHAPSMSVVEFVLKYSYISHSIDFYSCNLVYVLFFRSKNDLSVSVFDSFLMDVIANVIAPSTNTFPFCCSNNFHMHLHPTLLYNIPVLKKMPVFEICNKLMTLLDNLTYYLIDHCDAIHTAFCIWISKVDSPSFILIC